MSGKPYVNQTKTFFSKLLQTFNMPILYAAFSGVVSSQQQKRN